MPSALQDIKNILDYVRRQSVQNAEKLTSEFKERIASLQQFPERVGL
ncbi:type II toxin-antitoxin system RelE/ParE family toxin [Flavisolibacter sp. BT320]|nr:type II toxin-antitoxin system RelE/ParE family toxin [Flavisolibacter longurius]